MKIEHAAAYLPYGLNYFSNVSLSPKEMGTGNMHLLISGDVKPILRPISDLTKEITENGETFVPIHAVLAMCMKGGKHERDFLYSVSTGLTFIQSIPMWAMQKLLSWHFDIFGLIESGEAIDVNTLEKNPYE